ncbi:3-hydroxy acid dehydrogenase [Purpureocillium takamizusanense]|uniref:3-hydroxy acid dehydrogenase n=1 Tax=Purpureocillium takamizusanense TaxID=2060973 RepID=A0A9Q8VC60_9HYPO|nr:3-hydroxy acid dehydrogenase [Purpureocillium takamizusanense]UNI20388.1 3-hydroxy acid dehydrogenase [Purpureocillium takamizusanense]
MRVIVARFAPRCPPSKPQQQQHLPHLHLLLRRRIASSALVLEPPPPPPPARRGLPAPPLIAGRFARTTVAVDASSRSRLPPARTIMTSAASQRLAGKTILITGASSGIGRSTALEFARTSPNDLRLVLTARRVDALRDLADQIRNEVGQGVKVLPVKLDVSNADEIRGFVACLPEEWRDIHVLVNNAGLVKGVARAPDIDEQDMDVVFSTNVTGLINMTQAILPIFQGRPGGGQGDIINVGSIAGREAYPGGSIYCASKAAVRSFTDTLRKELIATRIRVIEIDPGQVETEFSLVRFYGDKAKADAVYAGVEPLTPDDIAEAIVFTATRRENVVIADTLIYPNHQASALIMHRKNV